MSRLLHMTARELNKVHSKHDERHNTEDIEIYLDWGRDGKEKLQLLTVIKNVPKKIVEHKTKNNGWWR